MAVYRNGAILTDCTAVPPQQALSPTTACVSLREQLADGDLRLTVLTTDASVWGSRCRGAR